jgi:hypothetical protein
MARVGFGKFAHILKVKRAEPLWVPPGPRGDSREKSFTRGWNNFLSTDYSAFLEVVFSGTGAASTAAPSESTHSM